MEEYKNYFVEDLGMQYPTEKSPKKYRYWNMLCKDCGKLYRTDMKSVKRSKYLTCPECSELRRVSKMKTVDSLGANKKLYQAWADMKSRCYNKKSSEYHRYGGRGITVCEEWKTSSKAFIDWAQSFGDTSKLSLDRIDPNGNYTPENCRWETKTVQARNTRTIGANNTSGYKGVSYEKRRGTWAAKIAINNKHIRIGTYKTALEASYAYDKYVIDNNLEHTINHKTAEEG